MLLCKCHGSVGGHPLANGFYRSLSSKPNSQLLPDGQSADRCPEGVADGGDLYIYLTDQY